MIKEAKRMKRLKPRLDDHRRRLKRISPDEEKINGLAERLADHLRAAGFSGGKDTAVIRVAIVKALLKAQDNKPFFWVLIDEMPYCWNRPDKWEEDIDYMIYEWGHVVPLNEGEAKGGKEGVENLCLMSSRCNNNIQSSLNMKDVRKYFDGSAIARRIDRVQEQRDALFTSRDWISLMEKLKRHPKRNTSRKAGVCKNDRSVHAYNL
jgi:hypothetical protein